MISTPNARPIQPHLQPPVSPIFFALRVPRPPFKGRFERNSKSQLDFRVFCTCCDVGIPWVRSGHYFEKNLVSPLGGSEPRTQPHAARLEVPTNGVIAPRQCHGRGTCRHRPFRMHLASRRHACSLREMMTAPDAPARTTLPKRRSNPDRSPSFQTMQHAFRRCKSISPRGIEVARQSSLNRRDRLRRQIRPKPQRKRDLSADDAEGRRCKGGSLPCRGVLEGMTPLSIHHLLAASMPCAATPPVCSLDRARSPFPPSRLNSCRGAGSFGASRAACSHAAA